MLTSWQKIADNTTKADIAPSLLLAAQLESGFKQSCWFLVNKSLPNSQLVAFSVRPTLNRPFKFLS